MPSIHKRQAPAAPVAPNLGAQAQALDVSALQLEQRCRTLQAQAQAEKNKAREYLRAGNRTLARSSLQRSKMYEKQLESASAQLTMFSNMRGNVAGVQSLQEGVRAMAGANAAMRSVDMDKLGDQMMDAVGDMQEVNMEMQAITGQMDAMNEMMMPDIGGEMAMLDDELNVLGQMDIPDQPLGVAAPTPVQAKPQTSYSEMMGKFL